MLCDVLVQENFWYILAWYQFVDGQSIFPTSFELTVYLVHLWVQSNIQACKTICETYTKKYLEPLLQQVLIMDQSEEEKRELFLNIVKL
jgi:hypothetical protein